MRTSEISLPSKPFENLLLLLLGLLAHAPLYYQLPRMAYGLSPTFVHPGWIAHSPCPIVLYMSKVHPAVWTAIMVLCFVRLCHNYGWRLDK